MTISSVATNPVAAISPYPKRSKGAADASESASAKPDETGKASAAATASAPAMTKTADTPSAVTSLTSGILGLDNPSEVKPPREENTYYTAGRVLAAAGTVGTIISLMV
jgi:hypothetical protein